MKQFNLLPILCLIVLLTGCTDQLELALIFTLNTLLFFAWLFFFVSLGMATFHKDNEPPPIIGFFILVILSIYGFIAMSEDIAINWIIF